MSNFEVRSFVKFAPNYFEYVKTADMSLVDYLNRLQVK